MNSTYSNRMRESTWNIVHPKSVRMHVQCVLQGRVNVALHHVHFNVCCIWYVCKRTHASASAELRLRCTVRVPAKSRADLKLVVYRMDIELEVRFLGSS